MVEHPFGTIKQAFAYSHFLYKGLEMVNAEMSLSVLTYNMRRILNIKGFKELLAALAAKKTIYNESFSPRFYQTW